MDKIRQLQRETQTKGKWMRRPEGPWYRSFNDAWYVQKDGQQILLAKGKDNEQEAWEAYRRLMAERTMYAKKLPDENGVLWYTMSEFDGAKSCIERTDKPRWEGAPQGEWRCFNSDCMVRECIIKAKPAAHGEKKLPPMKCPVCQNKMDFLNWIRFETLLPVKPEQSVELPALPQPMSDVVSFQVTWHRVEASPAKVGPAKPSTTDDSEECRLPDAIPARLEEAVRFLEKNLETVSARYQDKIEATAIKAGFDIRCIREAIEWRCIKCRSTPSGRMALTLDNGDDDEHINTRVRIFLEDHLNEGVTLQDIIREMDVYPSRKVLRCLEIMRIEGDACFVSITHHDKPSSRWFLGPHVGMRWKNAPIETKEYPIPEPIKSYKPTIQDEMILLQAKLNERMSS